MEIQKEGKIGRVLKPLKKELWEIYGPDIASYEIKKGGVLLDFEETIEQKYQPSQLSTVLWIEQEDEYFLDPGNLYRLIFYLTASLWLFDEGVMNAGDESGYFLNVAYYDIKSYYEEKMWEVIPEGYKCRELLEKDIKRFFKYLDENPELVEESI